MLFQKLVKCCKPHFLRNSAVHVRYESAEHERIQGAAAVLSLSEDESAQDRSNDDCELHSICKL